MVYSYTNTFYSHSLCHHHTAFETLKYAQTLGQFFEPLYIRQEMVTEMEEVLRRERELLLSSQVVWEVHKLHANNMAVQQGRKGHGSEHIVASNAVIHL